MYFGRITFCNSLRRFCVLYIFYNITVNANELHSKKYNKSLINNNNLRKLFYPWKFQELQPTVDFIENLDQSISWTMSAGELVKMLDPKLYNRLQPPGQIFGRTTHIEVAIYIESMSTFRAQSMDFEMDMYLLMAWQDFRLEHKFAYPILCTDQYIANRMWEPDLYFVNSKFSYMHQVTKPNFLTLIYPDGYIIKSMRIDVTLACVLNLRHFPFDTQSCSAKLQSYAFINNIVNLTWHHGRGYPINANPKIKLNDMDIQNFKTEISDSVYPLFRKQGTWSCLKVVVNMKRKINFYIFQTFIPTGLLVIVSWLSFWLDIKASAARITLTITTFLSLTMISNGSRKELPNIPYMKASDIWLTVCQGFIFSVLLEYILISVLCDSHTSSNNGTETFKKSVFWSPILIGFKIFSIPDSKRKDWEIFARTVDNFAKILFPSCFVLFIIIYVSVYCIN